MGVGIRFYSEPERCLGRKKYMRAKICIFVCDLYCVYISISLLRANERGHFEKSVFLIFLRNCDNVINNIFWTERRSEITSVIRVN